MFKVFLAGIGAACVTVIVTFALHLLNEPSDAAVALGYFILVALIAAGVGLVQTYRRRS